MRFFSYNKLGDFMLKKIVRKKIILIIAITFSFSLLYLLPEETKFDNQELSYVDSNQIKKVIYLLDQNNYVARTTVAIKETEIEEKASELLEILIKDGKGESKIPSGFSSLISSETKINSIFYDNNILKVDFSEELLDCNIQNEEKIIEAIVYTLTSIEGVDKVIIYVEGDILTKLPKTGINLPATLDKSYGINKEYDITNYKDIDKTTIYYVSKYNDEYYYVPVTKYTNEKKEKIKVIIDELASSSLYTSNLMSFLNSNTVLLSSEVSDNALSLVFNNYILNDTTTNNILEEVIYTISLSVEANYDVDEVIFQVGDNEIYKSVIKTLEN
jgi:germination protein M